MVELRKDIPFYENSNGGITLSGGEPLFQPEFALAVFKQCKAEGLHTALDTSGQMPWRVYERVLPYVDLVLYDLKHIDPVTHRKYTGASNDLILDNLVKISEYGLSRQSRDVPIEIRMPIIPEINDAKKDIVGAAMFLSTLKNIILVDLLPYHRLGESKYSRLGEKYKLEGLQPPSKEHMNEIAEWIRSYGLEVHVGG
jgi:pyruvate formate lyase activating enzyme